MKTINYILFYTIFLAIYGLVNYYIYIRGLHSIPQNSPYRNYYIAVFLFISLAFIAGRLLERVWTSPLSDALILTGSFWLAAMLYFVLVLLCIDIMRLVNHFVTIFPSFITANYTQAKQYAAYSATFLVGILILVGSINARSPRIKTLNLSVSKKVDKVQSVNIVMVSDIHLGTIIGKHKFDKIVNTINSLNPDLVLFPGDIVDEDVTSIINDNVGESFKRIRSKYGIYACTGNHEYISGVEEACSFLTKNGITVLRDSNVLVNNSFYLFGREDRMIRRVTNKSRKSLPELLATIDTNIPIIVMDHQPFDLEQTAKYKIDLQLSGHTHNGQIWPLNYIAEKIYEISWGYLKKSDTHFYVSCGVGTWGPPVRSGNRPEIVNIKLRFE
jgi:predicted MPP superfamily phosphohydrolase